jgi:hypothetical protein
MTGVVVAQRRHQTRQRRPVDAGQSAQRELGHRHQRTGIASGHERVCVLRLHRRDGAAHGGGLGAADRLGRLFAAFDHVGAGDDRAGRLELREFRKLGRDQRLVAEEDEVEVVALFQRAAGAGDDRRRTQVATHRVDCDPWPAAQPITPC